MITLPQGEQGRRIALLGGSFDPPHLGHQLLAVCALALEKVDELWVLPCADHPFAKKLSPFAHRMKMCELAFEMLSSKVKVLGLEQELPAPNYTVKTLEALLDADPSLKLSLVMGSDVYGDLPRWKNPERLAELSKLVVFLRDGSPLSALSEVQVPATIHTDFVLPHIKSTVIREQLKEGVVDDLGFMDQRVLAYAQKHVLYTK